MKSCGPNLLVSLTVALRMRSNITRLGNPDRTPFTNRDDRREPAGIDERSATL